MAAQDVSEATIEDIKSLRGLMSKRTVDPISYRHSIILFLEGLDNVNLMGLTTEHYGSVIDKLITVEIKKRNLCPTNGDIVFPER